MNPKLSTIWHVSIATLIIMLSSNSYSKEWGAPPEIKFKGTSYKVAFKNEGNEQTKTYEYTTNGETVENWTTLFSVIFTKSPSTSLNAVAYNLVSALNARNPKPRYEIYSKDNYLISRIVYDFSQSRQLPYFESNTRKIFYSSSCGGFFDISFALKRISKTESAEDLENLLVENKLMTNDLIADSWEPNCESR